MTLHKPNLCALILMFGLSFMSTRVTGFLSFYRKILTSLTYNVCFETRGVSFWWFLYVVNLIEHFFSANRPLGKVKRY